MTSRSRTSGPSPQLSLSIDRAIGGTKEPLLDILCRGSGLPGARANMNLAAIFAAECASRGSAADALITYLVSLDADAAPGGGSGTYGAGSELEFLPLCGVLAAGARVAHDPSALSVMLPLLHEAAGDLRFRVRDVVPLALEMIGRTVGDALADEVIPWMDGYFHAAAVLRGITQHEWLVKFSSPTKAIDLFSRAFELAVAAPRAAARYPGFKALLEALTASIEPLAMRLGVPMFDALAAFARVKDPVLRDLITDAVVKGKLHSRHRSEVERVLGAFKSTAKPVRDPRSLPGPTRRRGRLR